MQSTPPQLNTEVVDALTGFESAVQVLTKISTPGEGRLGVEPLVIVEFIRRFEGLRNQLAQVDQHIVQVCDTRQVANELTQRNTATLLANTLRLSAGEAARRVRSAAALSPKVSALGVPSDPARPVLAAAVATGSLSAENVDIAVRCLDTLSRIPGMPAEHLEQAEHDLTSHAGVLRPEDLRAVVTKIIECYDPDGQDDRDRKNEALRELRLVPHHDGSYSIAGRLTGDVGTQLSALLTPLAKPRPAEPTPDTTDPDDELTAGTGSETRTSPTAPRLHRAKTAVTHDMRTPAQRWHDAFADLIARAARFGDQPASGGVPATVIVTISYEDLLTKTGHGVSTDGTPLSAAAVLKLADEALILPTVLTSSGAVLSQGRSCRIATRNQTLALVARDGGCTFPGCDHPTAWSERHHIRGWVDGGATDLDNLTLVCGYHHRNFEPNGWTCQMIDDMPHWTPPVWIDPDQIPILHHRLKMKHRTDSGIRRS